MKARNHLRIDPRVPREGAGPELHRSGLHVRPKLPPAYGDPAQRDELASAIAGARTLSDAFDAAVGALADTLPLRAAALVSADDGGRPLVWCAEPTERAAATAEAVALSTLAQFVRADEGDVDPLAGGAMGKLGWIAVPLRHDGRFLGLVAVATRAPDPGSAAIALIVEAARRLAPRVGEDALDTPASSTHEVLGEVCTTLVETLDYRRSLARVARLLGRRVGTACVIDVRGRSPSQIVHAGSIPEPALIDVLGPLLERAVGRRAALTIDHPLVTLAAEELKVAWIIVLPLRARDEVVGAMALLGPEHRPPLLARAQFDMIARHLAAAITNGQLYEAAADAARLRDELLAAVSHDLKNPLNVILLSASRMRDGGPDAQWVGGQPAAEIIHRSAQRMRRLVADLLDIAQLDARQMRLRPAPHDPRALVSEAVAALRPMAIEARVSLDHELGADLPHVRIDADRIQQVLSNLIGNAVKFTRPGGRVCVRARVHEGALEIAVADSGIGIAPEDLPHVFDRFWRARDVRQSGTGLGLCIAKSIVELSGGAISAESEPGVGTVVRVTLPVA